MSMQVSLRLIGTLPTAWTASVWNMTPAERASSAISSTGNRVPVSLLAHITETMATRSDSRSMYSRMLSRPRPSTLRRWTL